MASARHQGTLPLKGSLGAVLAALLALGWATMPDSSTPPPDEPAMPYVVVLGTAQDGGYPQSGCAKPLCEPAWRDHDTRRYVSSIAVIDPTTGKRWLFDATPDFRDQLRLLDDTYPVDERAPGLAGIFLTHAHVGHYTGLMMLGREVLGASRVHVYAMPRMKRFLETNGPWNQLVRLENIMISDLEHGMTVELTESISVTPFLVPHRDEYSETVAFIISGPKKKVLFVPDIDKWKKWDLDIEQIVTQVDVAYVDGTFFANGEIPGRDMSEIPHPFIRETMKRLEGLPANERSRIRFIHLNHTNPALLPDSDARREIETKGFRLAEQGERFEL